MPRELPPFLILVNKVRKSVLLRLGLLALALLWGFDEAIYFVTEGSWFHSLGLGSLWLTRCEIQLQLFAGASLVLWLAARGPLIAIDRPGNGTAGQPLPARTRLWKLEPLRRRWPVAAQRLIWLEAVIFAWHVAAHWDEWVAWCYGGAWGYREPHFGYDAAVWLAFLPLAHRWLRLLVWYSLSLLVLSASGGVLRALPGLLQRNPITPVRLWRSLWLQAAVLLALRAGDYWLSVLDLAEGSRLDAANWWVVRPLLLCGALLCLVLALRAALWAVRPAHRFSRAWAGALLLAWMGPGVLTAGLGLWHWLLPPGDFAADGHLGTTWAWGLPAYSPINYAAVAAREHGPAIPLEGAWPVWDENHLVDAARRAGPNYWTRTGVRASKTTGVVNWSVASLTRSQSGWEAVVAGYPASAEQIGAFGTDEDSAIDFLRLDPTRMDAGLPVQLPESPLRLAFYGLSGPPLVADDGEAGGVDVSSWFAKLAWAWRLRDPALPFQAASSTHLLVWRGAEERAQCLLPWLTPCGPAHPVHLAGAWFWELDLLSATTHFPGAQSVAGEPFSGSNAAWDSVKMLMDAHTGETFFYAVRQGGYFGSPYAPSTTGYAVPDGSALALRPWVKVLPELFRDWGTLPAGLSSHLRYPDAMLAAQESLLRSVLSAGGGVHVVPGGSPEQAVDPDGESVNRVVTLTTDGARVMEMLEGPHYGATWEMAAGGPLEEALERLDGGVPSPSEGASGLDAGEPFVWPKAQSGGRESYWVARPWYDVGDESTLVNHISGHGALLDRVVVTATDGAALGAGPDARSALADWAAHSWAAQGWAAHNWATPVPLPVAGAGAAAQVRGDQVLADQALAAHEAVMDDFRHNRMARMQADWNLESALLQQLIVRAGHAGPVGTGRPARRPALR